MSMDDSINKFIDNNPGKSLQLVCFGLALLWQTPAALIGLVLAVVLANQDKIEWWMTLVTGGILAFFAFILSGESAASFIHHGFFYNKVYWKCVANNHPADILKVIYYYSFKYFISLPLLLAGVFVAIEMIVNGKPHKAAMKSLQEGERPKERKEISAKKIKSRLKKIDESQFNSTVLGISKYTGNYAVVPDNFVNQLVLILGTTGGGKTITLRRFHHRAISKGYPLVVIDGKPSDENVEWLRRFAEQHNRPFYGFNCGNFYHYDCLASGGYTELKDKIISLKDEWESEYYRSIAEDYLQTTLQALLKSGKPFDLKMIARCLNYDNLLNLVHDINDEELSEQVKNLANYESKDIRGLQAHLYILINSELGKYFTHNEQTFSLPQVIEENAVVYFALPALRFPSFAKVLGKLVINDLKAVIDRYSQQNKRVFMVFDEFSVFAGNQVLNLVNMGRGKGVHAIFGTQGLSDLDQVSQTFKDQMLNCVNTIICHRVNDQVSAEGVATWIGTQDTMTVTAQIGEDASCNQKGSVRWSKEFIVHPDAIKQGLQPGEAFYITKVGKFWQDKVRVKYI